MREIYVENLFLTVIPKQVSEKKIVTQTFRCLLPLVWGTT